MNFKRFIGLGFLIMIIGVVSCAPQPVESPLSMEDSVATMAAATIQALPSNTPYPTPTLVPTLKLSPTVSPTETPIPTLPKLATPTVGGDIVNLGRYFTATPLAWACEIEMTSPEWGTKIRGGKDFRAIWRVYNTGQTPWTVDDIEMFYIGGDRMHNPLNNNKPVYRPVTVTPPYVINTPNPKFTATPRSYHKVFPGEKIVLHMRMYAPKEPGLYTAVWGLRREKRTVAFCAFSVTIRVEK